MEQTSRKSDIRTETYPRPSTVEGIVSLFREIMSAGRVQRIEFDVNLPVRVQREVEAGDPDLLEPDVNMDGALRNVEMYEYFSEDASSFQVVVDMMQLMSSEGRHCICWAVGTGENDLLSNWLEFKERGMPSGVVQLLNIPVLRLRSLPEDTLILCGSEYPSANPEEVTLAVKTAIEIRRPNAEATIEDRQPDDPVWPNPAKRSTTTRELALATGRLRRTRWDP